MLCRHRPGALRDNCVGENTLRTAPAAGGVVGLPGRDLVAQLLGELAREVRTADGTLYRACLIDQVAGAVRQGRDGDQAGVEALRGARPLVIHEEERLVLLDWSAESSAELILAVEAALGREKVASVEIGVAEELKRVP